MRVVEFRELLYGVATFSDYVGVCRACFSVERTVAQLVSL
ncbi:hypothetical protein PC116_g20935 [Phytophthora cactorum]|nr:hypothetical protein Pcac1_g12626 [Phytophthora cactorum]KAG3144211.1 hypothetical protein C6341_g18803 [Phytophthora cactorum]KAG4230779.1 hypothetical protein PC116_g20935 [Phytophthora cactorum]